MWIEEDGKTHRPIVPAGRQPKSRPLICRSNIREALGWLVGWLVGGKEVPGVRRTPNQSGVHERHEKEGGGREGGWPMLGCSEESSGVIHPDDTGGGGGGGSDGGDAGGSGDSSDIGDGGNFIYLS
ncbi:hypothetical protein HZH66_014887 [Vespula vulgaris]|uniref:Uncharacterized protein n=1 Tax=Vespula vulgaris TaxID=7454 RepID=A0A834J5R5_VESVU|nr:hypothetical protein HZH66_014887 [Vespula vulgaris]